MERVHKHKLQEKFKSQLRAKRIIVLGIPDNYKYMEPELVRILESAVRPHLAVRNPPDPDTESLES